MDYLYFLMIIPVRYFPPMEYELHLLVNHSITNLPYFILNIINLLMNHSIPNLPISYYLNFKFIIILHYLFFINPLNCFIILDWMFSYILVFLIRCFISYFPFRLLF